MLKQNTFGIQNTQYSIELSIHKPPSAFNTTYTIQSRVNCSNMLTSILPTYTYIIGHYNPLVRIIDLVSHTIYVVCVNFIHKWRGTYSFKVDSERQIFFKKLFMAILFALRVFARNLLRGNRRGNTFCILF